jgi:hypothetical protein
LSRDFRETRREGRWRPSGGVSGDGTETWRFGPENPVKDYFGKYENISMKYEAFI